MNIMRSLSKISNSSPIQLINLWDWEILEQTSNIGMNEKMKHNICNQITWKKWIMKKDKAKNSIENKRIKTKEFLLFLKIRLTYLPSKLKISEI